MLAGGVKGSQRLFCELTLMDGEVVWDWNSRGGVGYKTPGSSYGVREGVDHIVKPPQ